MVFNYLCTGGLSNALFISLLISILRDMGGGRGGLPPPLPIPIPHLHSCSKTFRTNCIENRIRNTEYRIFIFPIFYYYIISFRRECSIKQRTSTFILIAVAQRKVSPNILIFEWAGMLYNLSLSVGQEVEDVQIGYSVSKLSHLSTKLETARRARLYCENFLRKERTTMYFGFNINF
jgi:hypothetical protein